MDVITKTFEITVTVDADTEKDNVTSLYEQIQDSMENIADNDNADIISLAVNITSVREHTLVVE